jgi:CRP-like cAMP-binding protein
MLSGGCRFRSYSSGGIIINENDRLDQGFLVCTGRVALLKTSTSGKQLIVELLPPGDIFGLTICVDEQPFPLTARAQIALEVLWVPKTVFEHLLASHPELYHDFISVISERLRRSYSLSRALAHDRVDVRLASALTSLIPRFGAFDSQKGSHKIQITRQELADLTGTSVETAIRITKNMERDGMLDLSETGIVRILDIDKLLKLTEE